MGKIYVRLFLPLMIMAIVLAGCSKEVEETPQEDPTPQVITDISEEEPLTGPFTEIQLNSIAEKVFDNFQPTMEGKGYVCLDVSEMNQGTYPGATVLQGGDENLTYYILSGTANDADMFWFFYYNMALQSAEDGTFIQKYVPEDMNQPRSVMAVVDGRYFRCDIIGAITVVGQGAPSYAMSIDEAFADMGVPENPNQVE